VRRRRRNPSKVKLQEHLKKGGKPKTMGLQA